MSNIVYPKLSYSDSSHECFAMLFLINWFPVAECVHASASPRRRFRFQNINAELVFFFSNTLLQILGPTCTDKKLKIS